MVEGVILSVVQAAVYTAIMVLYMRHKGVFSVEKRIPDTEQRNVEIPVAGDASARDDLESRGEDLQKEETGDAIAAENYDLSYYTRRQSLILSIVMFLMCIAIDVLLYKYYSERGGQSDLFIYFRASFINALCFSAALTDFKRRKIPNDLILAGLAVKALILICEFFFCTRDVFISRLKSDGLGFLLGFVVLLIIGVVTKGLGFGDVKLFGIIGLMMGAGGVMNILFASLVFSAVVGIIMIVLRKKSLKSSMPMAPFILAGTVVIEILGLF